MKKGLVKDMSHQDYVRFLTERLVSKMNNPKTKEQLPKAEPSQQIYSNRWFGLFPFTLKLLFKK